MDIRRTFEQGLMNKDLDERLVPNGYFTHAENIITDSNNGSDLGVVKNMLSNKKVTDIDFGNNPITLFTFSDETEHKIYWFVLSDTGSFVLEYNDIQKTTFILLKDTRPDESRVLRLKKEHRIKSVRKIFNEDTSKNLLIWTDNNMEVCCINIERAKSFGENNFEEEDIYLIKKPPIFSPKVNLIRTNTESNEVLDKFVLFAYRYKYIDGEYSAKSPLSYYKFSPKPFAIDYDTLYNKSMENYYNAMDISFDTGDHRVIEIQVLAKFSNSINFYIVETFNKSTENWGDNEIRNLLYTNKKLYTVLPESEYYRNFDNVPRKANAMTLVGNRIVLGNYTEGYDLITLNGDKIKADYSLSIESININEVRNVEYIISTSNPSTILIPSFFPGNQNLILKQNNGFEIFIIIKDPDKNYKTIYEETHIFLLDKDYTSIQEMVNSEEFQSFLSVINNDIKNNFINDYPGTIIQYPYITISSDSLISCAFSLQSFIYEEENIEIVKFYVFSDESTIRITPVSIPTSLKSYQDYEVGIIYEDSYKRSSTPLTTSNNTVFVPLKNASSQNKLKIEIKHEPPFWAKYYRFAIKSKTLNYQSVYVNKFYIEDGFTWAKLEGDNKDKVKENDYLLVKLTPSGPIEKPTVVQVLEIANKDKDFILGNKDNNGIDIIEPAGLYMKIKPIGFSMGDNDYVTRQTFVTEKARGSGNKPIVYASLFSIKDENDQVIPFEIPRGSIIEVYIRSANKPDSGWKDNILNKTYYSTIAYESLGKWFNENIVSLSNLYGNEGNAPDNYSGYIEVVKGYVTYSVGVPVFIPNENGLEFLKVTGTKSGMSSGRNGYLDVRINVRTSDGFYVFETQTKKEIDQDIYYLSEEVFAIENNFHKGNIQNQNLNDNAICLLSYFNCFSFGNGIESYKIKDGFNTNFLNIDYSPTTTTIEPFKENIRQSDFTWSEVYNESSNINGLNEFNPSRINWRELDKQNGVIQLLYSREGNMLVIQTDKWGQVLFGKAAIYTAEGNPSITTTDDVFRDYIPYAGEYGITDIESFIVQGNRCYGVDKKRGTVLRLSIDGLSEINTGLRHWFKSTFKDRYSANVIGGLNPYYDTYQICIDEQENSILEVGCGQTIIKYEQNEVFEYKFNVNNIMNDIIIDYNISEGIVNIEARHGHYVTNLTEVTSTGQIIISRTIYYPSVFVKITPVTNLASFTLSNICPVGNKLKIFTVILNSPYDEGRVFSHNINRNNNLDYRTDVVLLNTWFSVFNEEVGNEGFGKFPTNGDNVIITLPFDSIVTKKFNSEIGNKVKYLITDQNYQASDVQLIIQDSTEIDMIQLEDTSPVIGNFIFNRDNLQKNLYLVYDLRSYAPTVVNGDFTITASTQIIPLDQFVQSDVPLEEVNVTHQPENGNGLVSGTNAIVFAYTGDSPQNDTSILEYEVIVGGISYPGIINLTINIPSQNE